MRLAKIATAIALLGAAATMTGVAHARTTGQSIMNGFTPEGELWYSVGDAFISSDFVRLVPDRQSKKGGFWCKEPIQFDDWEVEFSFRIHGVSAIGADGLAFWYSRSPGRLGTLFGHEELYDGLGVVVDTYDNENTGVHPYIFAMHNDGQHTFTASDHDHRKDHVNPGYDGANVFGELNGCSAHIRNTREPVLMNVRYQDKRLTVTYKLESAKEWTSCFEVPKITLPKGYYFGFSAATGDLADDHDVMKITVTDLQSSRWSKPLQERPAAAATGRSSVVTNTGLSAINDKLGNVIELVKDTLSTTLTTAGTDDENAVRRVSELEKEVADLKEKLKNVAAKSDKTILDLTAVDAQMAKVGKSGAGNGNGDTGSSGLNIFLFVCIVCAAGLAFYFSKMFKKEKSKKMF